MIDVEYRDSHPFGNKGPGVVNLDEPLHDNSEKRIIEAVENMAKRIAHVAGDRRSKIVCGRLTLGSADLKLTVYEFEGTL